MNRKFVAYSNFILMTDAIVVSVHLVCRPTNPIVIGLKKQIKVISTQHVMIAMLEWRWSHIVDTDFSNGLNWLLPSERSATDHFE